MASHKHLDVTGGDGRGLIQREYLCGGPRINPPHPVRWKHKKKKKDYFLSSFLMNSIGMWPVLTGSAVVLSPLPSVCIQTPGEERGQGEGGGECVNTGPPPPQHTVISKALSLPSSSSLPSPSPLRPEALTP